MPAMGAASTRELNDPEDIAFGQTGELYISDRLNSVVREVSPKILGQDVTVAPAPLTITAKNQTKIYGHSFNFAGNGFTTGTLYNGDTVSSVSFASLGAAASAAVTASPYSIVPSAAVGSGLGNYTIAYANGSLTVNQAPLSITAVSATMVAGQAVPALVPSFSGFLDGDSAASLSTAPVLSTSATSASHTGSYSITVSGTSHPITPLHSLTACSRLLAVRPRSSAHRP